MVQNRVLMRRIFAGLTEFRYRGPVGASVHQNLVDILNTDFTISSKTEINFLVKCVDEEIKELVIADFTVACGILDTPQQADFSTNRLCEVLRLDSDSFETFVMLFAGGFFNDTLFVLI